MTQPIRTIAAYYETEGRNAVSPSMAQELCETAASHFAPHVGPIAIDLEGTHMPDNPVEPFAAHFEELGRENIAFFTKARIEAFGNPVNGTGIGMGEGGAYMSRLLVRVPRLLLGRQNWLKALATHEMGHSFGIIDHCPEEACIMYGELSALRAKDKLSGEAFCGMCVRGLHGARQAILAREAARQKETGSED